MKNLMNIAKRKPHTVETPRRDSINLFLDELTGKLSYKDDTGVIRVVGEDTVDTSSTVAQIDQSDFVLIGTGKQYATMWDARKDGHTKFLFTEDVIFDQYSDNFTVADGTTGYAIILDAATNMMQIKLAFDATIQPALGDIVAGMDILLGETNEGIYWAGNIKEVVEHGEGYNIFNMQVNYICPNGNLGNGSFFTLADIQTFAGANASMYFSLGLYMSDEEQAAGGFHFRGTSRDVDLSFTSDYLPVGTIHRHEGMWNVNNDQRATALTGAISWLDGASLITCSEMDLTITLGTDFVNTPISDYYLYFDNGRTLDNEMAQILLPIEQVVSATQLELAQPIPDGFKSWDTNVNLYAIPKTIVEAKLTISNISLGRENDHRGINTKRATTAGTIDLMFTSLHMFDVDIQCYMLYDNFGLPELFERCRVGLPDDQGQGSMEHPGPGSVFKNCYYGPESGGNDVTRSAYCTFHECTFDSKGQIRFNAVPATFIDCEFMPGETPGERNTDNPHLHVFINTKPSIYGLAKPQVRQPKFQVITGGIAGAVLGITGFDLKRSKVHAALGVAAASVLNLTGSINTGVTVSQNQIVFTQDTTGMQVLVIWS